MKEIQILKKKQDILQESMQVKYIQDDIDKNIVLNQNNCPFIGWFVGPPGQGRKLHCHAHCSYRSPYSYVHSTYSLNRNNPCNIHLQDKDKKPRESLVDRPRERSTTERTDDSGQGYKLFYDSIIL